MSRLHRSALILSAFTPLAGAQTITSVSDPTPALSGLLVLKGSGFGAEQGGSSVLVSGVPAIVTFWSDAKIKCHVAESTPLGAGSIVVRAAGTSNPVAMTVVGHAPPAGRVMWRVRTDQYYALSTPVIWRDGTIYTSGVAGPVYAISPQGGVKWVLQNAGGQRPPALGSDGTIYVDGAGGSVTAVNPNGSIRWNWIAPPNSGGMFIGPSVGPDGKIYGVMKEEPSLGYDFGAFALHPDGRLAWSRGGGYNHRRIPYGWEAAFSGGMVVFTTGQGGPITGNPGVHALSMADGQEQWLRAGTGQPRTDDAGNIHWLGAVNGNDIGSYTASGAQRWTASYNLFLGQPGSFLVSRTGTSFYGTQTFTQRASFTAAGALRWSHRDWDHLSTFYGVNPDASVAIAHRTPVNNSAPLLTAISGADGSVLWDIPLPREFDTWVVPSWEGRFTDDGSVFYIVAHGNNYLEDPYSYLYAIRVGESAGCYPDCDTSTGPGTLDIFDFLCFQNRYGANDPYACDCDAGTGPGVCDIFDFLCFQNEFAAGCP